MRSYKVGIGDRERTSGEEGDINIGGEGELVGDRLRCPIILGGGVRIYEGTGAGSAQRSDLGVRRYEGTGAGSAQRSDFDV